MKLTLKHVSSTTYYFADRPYREFGHMTTANFVEEWGEGEDSFADDPPNAVLSTFGDDGVTEALIVLKNPILSGHNLVYEVDLQTGEIQIPHACVGVLSNSNTASNVAAAVYLKMDWDGIVIEVNFLPQADDLFRGRMLDNLGWDSLS